MTTRRDVFKFFGSLAMALIPARVMNQYIDPPFTPVPRYPVYDGPVPQEYRSIRMSFEPRESNDQADNR